MEVMIKSKSIIFSRVKLDHRPGDMLVPGSK